jgi:hypothetical protein
MPTLAFIAAIPSFLVAHWADLLALGAATTAVNQVVQKLASMLAPRFPWAARVANVCNTITVDYAKLLAEVGGALGIGPRAKPPTDGPGVAGIVLLVAILGLAGCASLGHWSAAVAPDVAVLCAFSGDVEPQLEQLAAQYGVPLFVVQDAFKAACSETARDNPDGARASGLMAARASAHAVRAMRANEDAGIP